jgi:SWI/SNF-related matrix-associated actin-dependent regulator of chromatin subfamily A3
MLTRLRQVALHPGLVPVSFLNNLRSLSFSEKSVSQSIVCTPAERTRLQEVLAQAIEDSEECPICMDILNNPRISGCGHMYCLTWCARSCIQE